MASYPSVGRLVSRSVRWSVSRSVGRSGGLLFLSVNCWFPPCSCLIHTVSFAGGTLFLLAARPLWRQQPPHADFVEIEKFQQCLRPCLKIQNIVHPQFQHHHQQMKTHEFHMIHRICLKVKSLFWTKNIQILKITDRALNRLILLKLRNFSSASGLA